MTDYQRQRVYNWQDRYLNDRSVVPIDQAQNLVNYLWAEFGLKYPPLVEPIHVNTKRWAGTANRNVICLQPTVATRTIVHEVAHSMTMTLDGDSCGHGPFFMGVYAKLLDHTRIMSIPEALYTCKLAGVDINIMAQPVFLD